MFSDALTLFQKVWLEGLIMLLITFGVMIVGMIILYIPLVAGAFIIDGTGSIEPSEEASILLLIGMFLVYVFLIAFMGFLTTGLLAAFYRQVRLRHQGLKKDRSVSWGMFFKKGYAGKLFLISLATTGISLVALLLCVFPAFYVAIPLQFVGVVFAFNLKLSLNEIITASFNIGTKKWGIAFALIIVSSLLAQMAGLILCGIGILFTASFVHLPVCFIYKEVVGFYEEDETIARIGA